MTRQRGEKQHTRLLDMRGLGKPQQRSERRTGDWLLMNLDSAAADLDGRNREGPPRMMQRREWRDLRARERHPRDRALEQRSREHSQDVASGDRDRSPRREKVLLRLIGLVEHRSGDPLDHHGHAHPAADTHRLNTELLVVLPERVDQGACDAGAGHPKRMPNGDSSSVDIQPVDVDA
jgi:hypothetical protein